MPKQLGVVATGMAIAGAVQVVSGLLGSRSAKKRAKRKRIAMAARNRGAKILRGEEAVRARRSQVRSALVGQAAIEAGSLAGGVEGSSGVANAASEVSSTLGTNLEGINTKLAEQNVMNILDTNVQNAGAKSSSDLFNENILGPAAGMAFNFFAAGGGAKAPGTQ